MVERVVDSRLIAYSDAINLTPDYQSAYRRNHSTETALVRLYNDMIRVIDNGQVGALVLLDMSAAFDTVDHQIMFDFLNHRFDIRDAALTWFHSYFDERSQVVKVGSDASKLGDEVVIWCSSRISSRSKIFRLLRRGCLPRNLQAWGTYVPFIFADDMQGHQSSQPQDAASIVASLQDCIIAISEWCASKRLQLNAKKTKVLWFGSVAGLRKVDAADRRLTIGTDVIQPVDVVRDLGVYFDSHLTMKSHVARVARTCF